MEWRASGRGTRAWVGAAAAVTLSILAPVADAASGGTVALAWSTYLRAGPAQTASAIAELEHDAPVDVLGCAGAWCHVASGGAQGYVDRDALTLPRTLAPVPPARTDCVVAGQADNRGPIPTRFCAAPVGPPT